MTQIRRGRPKGPIARAVLDAVKDQPATVREIAARLQLSYRAANVTVSRLHSAGEITYGGTVSGLHDRPARLVQVAEPEPAQSFAPGFPFIFWR